MESYQGPLLFFEFKDFIILFMSLGLVFGKSKFRKCLWVSFILTTFEWFLYSEMIFFTLSFCWLDESSKLVSVFAVLFSTAFIKWEVNSSTNFTSLSATLSLTLIEIWSSQSRFLLEKNGLTTSQNFLLAARSLEETDLKYCFLAF